MPKLPPPPRTAQNRSGLVVLVGADLGAVAEHQLDGGDAVGGQAELPGVPPDAAAEGVADDADVGGGAVQGGEAVRGGRLDDVLPEHARRDPDDPALRVDVDAGHRRGPQQDDVLERSPSGPALWPVPCGATRRPCAGRRPDDVADLVGVGGVGDGGGALVDGDVPRHPRGVVPGVSGQLDADGGAALEGVGAAGGRGELDGHDVSPR